MGDGCDEDCGAVGVLVVGKACFPVPCIFCGSVEVLEGCCMLDLDSVVERGRTRRGAPGTEHRKRWSARCDEAIYCHTT